MFSNSNSQNDQPRTSARFRYRLAKVVVLLFQTSWMLGQVTANAETKVTPDAGAMSDPVTISAEHEKYWFLYSKKADILLGSNDNVYVICPSYSGNAVTIYAKKDSGFALVYSATEAFPHPPIVSSAFRNGRRYWAELNQGYSGKTDVELRIGVLPESGDESARYELRSALPVPKFRNAAGAFPGQQGADYKPISFTWFTTTGEYLVIGDFPELHWGLGAWIGENPSYNKLYSIRLCGKRFDEPQRIDARGRWSTLAQSAMAQDDGTVRVAEFRWDFPRKNKNSICLLTQLPGQKWSNADIVAVYDRKDGDPSRGFQGTCDFGLYLGMCDDRVSVFWANAHGDLYLSQVREGKWQQELLVTTPSGMPIEVLSGSTGVYGKARILYRSNGGALYLISQQNAKWGMPVQVSRDSGRVVNACMKMTQSGDAHIVFLERDPDETGTYKYAFVPASK